MSWTKERNMSSQYKFEILSEELGNEELSIDYVIEKKFINTTNSMAKNLLMTSSTEIRKSDI